MSAPRRNEPCPCGSGLRYKECHGKLDAAGGGAPSADAIIQRALQLHQQGHIAEAEKRYHQVLELQPGHAIATHYLGLAAWHRGDLAEGERLMRASIEADATIPDFHNNLALLLRDTRRYDEAMAGFNRALAVDAGYYEASNNMGLTLEAADRFPQAVEAYRAAIAREPRFAAARQNLGRALVTLGQYREGWEQYRWRLQAQGVIFTAPDPAAPRLPAMLAGRKLALRAEQGLGDVLFFLRFAPELVRRGAKLAFQGDRRLHAMLDRTGLFELGSSDDGRPTDPEVAHVGDLPWLLEADNPALFPPPLRIPPLPERVARAREQLASFGAGPFVGLTWRSGMIAPGPVRTQFKDVGPTLLGQMVKDRPGTWVSVQRQPNPGERESLEQALGARVHDLSSANDDLEQILAVMAVLDDYVGTSNANTHLRAGLGLPIEVLVPFPPEWRWGFGERSPWFPTVKIVRQQANGRW